MDIITTEFLNLSSLDSILDDDKETEESIFSSHDVSILVKQ